MVCIFCLAVFAIFAGALTSVVLDQMEARLATVASEPVVRSVDSDSVAKFETSVEIPGKLGRKARSIPVAVTVYKKHKRIRIQVLTHDLTRAEAEQIEDLIAEALQLRIIDRSDAHDEQKVREAFGEDADEAEAVEVEPGELTAKQTATAEKEPVREQQARGREAR